MTAGRPAPDQEIDDGPVTAPRLAATVMLLRGETGALEVLLVQRTSKARFMAGAWVFPGGAVDPDDGPGQAGLRAAGSREVHEETGIELGGDEELVAFSNWITPAPAKIRFDTWFYLARMPSGQEPRVDGHEIVDARWLGPAAALAAAERGEMAIVFPTRKLLKRIAAYGSAAELLADARKLTVEPAEPRVIGSGEQARIVLPGEPGQEESSRSGS